jgi:hypothetical protein
LIVQKEAAAVVESPDRLPVVFPRPLFTAKLDPRLANDFYPTFCYSLRKEDEHEIRTTVRL